LSGKIRTQFAGAPCCCTAMAADHKRDSFGGNRPVREHLYLREMNELYAPMQ
jgi:hypothetical protein